MVWACAAKRRHWLGEEMYGIWGGGRPIFLRDGCSCMERSSNQCHYSSFSGFVQKTTKNISFHKVFPGILVCVPCPRSTFAHAMLICTRPRGRPKRTWKEVVQKDCQACSLNKEVAMDRGRWKKLINLGWWWGWWVGECFFWYRLTRVVPDKRP